MLVGCKGCKKKGSTTSGTTDFPGGGTVPEGAGGTPVGERGTGAEVRGQFQSVYFAYDSAAINPGERAKLQAVADWMNANRGKHILIEGHCDERGTTEYNRTLGERRALAAREALISMGCDASSITTVTLGEDRPMDPGHDEIAWSKNRRAEFVIQQ
jgi:peptidoglycan-associated lipoprotein